MPPETCRARWPTSALDHDFPEYVDPHSGAPRGTMKFSWTAALSLDLFERLHRSGETG